ncbi:hypothetical protein SNN80_004200 [Cronobacter sakazakii]|nr:hypothetical protein [Cronobacter sakazakii]
MDKSREQFQSWWEEWFGEAPLTPWNELWCGDGYSAEDIDHMWEVWQASRAAVEVELLADKRRMDWLVSKAVNVRDPMVYGSHSMFWSQVITDEEDDYYETKLREQIDAAMDAEAIRAAGLKVKGE